MCKTRHTHIHVLAGTSLVDRTTREYCSRCHRVDRLFKGLNDAPYLDSSFCRLFYIYIIVERLKSLNIGSIGDLTLPFLTNSYVLLYTLPKGKHNDKNDQKRPHCFICNL